MCAKLSQLHAELSEQASELGFESLGEAEQHGYGVDWENGKLIKVEDEQEKAHEAWLKERGEILEQLNGLLSEYVLEANIGGKNAVDKKNIIEDTIEFIKEQCHD